MQRHFFICDELSDLEIISSELEQNGFIKPQIHLISKNKGMHFLNAFRPVKDEMMVSLISGNYTKIISITFCLLFALVLIIFDYPLYALAWSLASILIFSYKHFTRKNDSIFISRQDSLNETKLYRELELGHYVLLVELSHKQIPSLKTVVRKHPELKIAGNQDLHFR